MVTMFGKLYASGEGTGCSHCVLLRLGLGFGAAFLVCVSSMVLYQSLAMSNR